MELKCCCGEQKTNENYEKVREIILKNKGIKGSLIPILHEIQDDYGYLPREAMIIVSEELEIPMTEIFGVASFYSYFSMEPKGEYVIRVCMGTACYVKGAQNLIDELSKELRVEVGNTTEDGKFTLESTRCLGACGLAPVLMINDRVYGRLTPKEIKGILSEYK